MVAWLCCFSALEIMTENSTQDSTVPHLMDVGGRGKEERQKQRYKRYTGGSPVTTSYIKTPPPAVH